MPDLRPFQYLPASQFEYRASFIPLRSSCFWPWRRLICDANLAALEALQVSLAASQELSMHCSSLAADRPIASSGARVTLHLPSLVLARYFRCWPGLTLATSLPCSWLICDQARSTGC